MQKLLITIFTLTSLSALATDPCTNVGGKIVSGTLGRGLVRVCVFKESGIGSASALR